MEMGVLFFSGRIEFHGYDMNVPVAYPALRYKAVGEDVDLLVSASQDERFQAIVMVKMDMHRRDADIMIVVL